MLRGLVNIPLRGERNMGHTGEEGGGGESETDSTTDLREKRPAPFFPPLKTDICHALERRGEKREGVEKRQG